MIRTATREDIESILDMGDRFFSATKYSALMDYSRDATKKTIEHLIEDDLGILLVLDSGQGVTGMVGALLYPFYMSGELTGQELFWWSEDKGRGLDLLKALEGKAGELGAKTFSMISLDGLDEERLDRIYQKNGYERSEHSYLKRL